MKNLWGRLKIRRPLWGHWRVRVSFRHSDVLTLPLPPPAGARGPSNRSVHHPWPPPPTGYFDFGGFGPNLCSTKVAHRASQGHQAAPRSPQEDRHFQTFFLSPGCLKSRPSWGLDLWTPCPFGGLGPNLCSTKIAPRASQGHQAAPRSPQEPQHFNKKFRKKSRTELWSKNLILIAPHGSPWFEADFFIILGALGPLGAPRAPKNQIL